MPVKKWGGRGRKSGMRRLLNRRKERYGDMEKLKTGRMGRKWEQARYSAVYIFFPFNFLPFFTLSARFVLSSFFWEFSFRFLQIWCDFFFFCLGILLWLLGILSAFPLFCVMMMLVLPYICCVVAVIFGVDAHGVVGLFLHWFWICGFCCITTYIHSYHSCYYHHYYQ